MTDLVFEALRDAVRVARERQIQSVRMLRRALKGMGYGDSTITEALSVWSQHLRQGNP